jgi:myo-inositol 2-dehydrogenase/D-chiro-inositol 1-dehydrogenase
VKGIEDGFHSARPPYFFMQRYAECYVNEVREFLECVRDDKTPPITGRDGRMAVVLGHAAWRSWKDNRPVKLSEIATV